jgi:cysteine desulfurase/selenocysteine lyase
MIHIDQVRQDTRGLDGKIFMNSAGSSLMPRQVTDAMRNYLSEEEELGGYKAEELRSAEIATFYKETGQLLNCNEKCIAFAYNATDAYAKALSSIPFQAGDYILTSNDDYVSNQIAFMSLQKRYGIQVIRANNLLSGDLDLEHFEAMLKQYRPALVSLTHIPTNSGMIQDAEAVGKLCLNYDTWYLLDACQSVGQLPVDVQSIGCDFLSATGRKFLRGPRGTGLLYVSETVLDAGLEPLIPDMRGAEWIDTNQYRALPDAKRFELLDVSYASLTGLTSAIRYANTIGMDQIFAYNQQLSIQLRSSLGNIPGIKLLDKGSSLSNIITCHWEGQQLETIETHLNAQNVIYSVSRKKNAFIDMGKKGVDWAVRFSPHYFNTSGEIESVCSIVAALGQQKV